jgi:predicted amidophosphoribosyltransferase
VAENVVKYKCVLLVDDIYTTGCTAETIAGELQRAGIEEIYVLSVCIATR